MLSIACKYLARLMHLRVDPSRFEVAAGFSRATLAPILTIEFHPQVSHLPVYQYNSELFHAARAFQTMQFHTCIVILYILLPPSKVALVNAAQGYHLLSVMQPPRTLSIHHHPKDHLFFFFILPAAAASFVLIFFGAPFPLNFARSRSSKRSSSAVFQPSSPKRCLKPRSMSGTVALRRG
jgi:hypothetical protein